MRKICATLFAVATALVGTEALAQEDWSVHGGDVLRSGDAIGGEFGWPDATFFWNHALSGKVDIGIRFPLIYGFETEVQNVYFGLAVSVPIRIQIVKSHKFSGMLIVEPGLKVYPDVGNNALFGPEFKFAFQGGVHITPEAQVIFGADFNFWLDVTNPNPAPNPIFFFAPEFGPGFEYHVDRNLAVGINMRFGPAISACNGCRGAEFGMVMQAFIGYHF